MTNGKKKWLDRAEIVLTISALVIVGVVLVVSRLFGS